MNYILFPDKKRYKNYYIEDSQKKIKEIIENELTDYEKENYTIYEFGKKIKFNKKKGI